MANANMDTGAGKPRRKRRAKRGAGTGGTRTTGTTARGMNVSVEGLYDHAMRKLGWTRGTLTRGLRQRAGRS